MDPGTCTHYSLFVTRPIYLLGIALLCLAACAEHNEEAAAPVYSGPCIGVEPEVDQGAAAPGPLQDPGEVLPSVAPELGASAPAFDLTDFQPQSCGFAHNYGLDLFEGRVTVAVLLASW